MSERIKSNQISRLSREEKEMLTQQVATLSTQVEKAVNSVFKYRTALCIIFVHKRQRTVWIILFGREKIFIKSFPTLGEVG